MEKWGIAGLLLLAAHFSASYLVPLDGPSQATFGGLLRWAWPWFDGDSGPLGTLVAGGELPLAGLLMAIGSGTLFAVAALAVMGWGVPLTWWRPLTLAGVALSVGVTVLFFGPTKLLPLAADAALIWLATSDPLGVGDTA